MTVMIPKARVFAAALCLLAPVAALAEGPAPFPEFTFKRVTPPKAGGKRITVQIAPQAAAPAPRRPATSAAAPRSSSYAWFWDDIAPEAEASAPGRLHPALVRLSNPPTGQSIGTPGLSTLMGIAKSHNAAILLSTAGRKVSPALVLAVIAVESGGRAEAQSRAGAQGLMQLMPDTAARFGVNDPFDASQNIRAGAEYLDWLMGHFGDDPILALAGYNAGEGAVAKHSGVPPFAETRDYVPKVLAAYAVARGLCRTPPELISDPCIFNLPDA